MIIYSDIDNGTDYDQYCLTKGYDAGKLLDCPVFSSMSAESEFRMLV